MATRKRTTTRRRTTTAPARRRRATPVKRTVRRRRTTMKTKFATEATDMLKAMAGGMLSSSITNLPMLASQNALTRNGAVIAAAFLVNKQFPKHKAVAYGALGAVGGDFLKSLGDLVGVNLRDGGNYNWLDMESSNQLRSGNNPQVMRDLTYQTMSENFANPHNI